MNRIMCFVILVCIAGPASSIASASTYRELLNRIPDSANALILLDVEGLFGSRLAKAENWRETYADRFAATPLMVPPDAKQFVLGAELDLETMKPNWEAASIEFAVGVNAKDIAQAVGGTEDSIAGSDVLWVRKDFCVAAFPPTEIGILSPANRQSAARWISRTGDATNDLSTYLQQAAALAENGPEVLMAIDLQDLIRPQEIRAAVERSKLVEAKDLAEVTSLLAGIQGVMISVRVDERIRGRLIVDFDKDTQPIAAVAKPMILKALENAGAMIEEFASWSPAAKGKRIYIEGELSAEGMRRLFSIVALDAATIQQEREPEFVEPPAEQPAEAPSKTKVGFASLRYFRAVTKYLDDIQGSSSQQRDFSQTALWISNYASKIEKIPAVNVDPDLVAYAQQVAYRLRDAVANIHGTAQRARQSASQVRDNSRLNVGAVPTRRRVNFGGIRMREYAPMAFAQVDIGAAQARQGIAAEAFQKGSAIAQQNMAQIKSETQAIRAQMTERYRLRF